MRTVSKWRAVDGCSGEGCHLGLGVDQVKHEAHGDMLALSEPLECRTLVVFV